jgi:hypothetical protein
MVKTHQLMRWLMYTIPGLDDTIRGFFAIFCHLRSRVNRIFLTLVAKQPQFGRKCPPGPALRIGGPPQSRQQTMALVNLLDVSPDLRE